MTVKHGKIFEIKSFLYFEYKYSGKDPNNNYKGGEGGWQTRDIPELKRFGFKRMRLSSLRVRKTIPSVQK